MSGTAVFMIENNLRNYLTLFGLDDSFSEEELNRSYRSLALLNHPDHAGKDSHLRMVIINEAHKSLAEYRQSHPPGPAKNDPVFTTYKKAVGELNDIFEKYYAHAIDINILKRDLLRVKDLFARIVRDYSSSDYFLDSVDRICSINRWFE